MQLRYCEDEHERGVPPGVARTGRRLPRLPATRWQLGWSNGAGGRRRASLLVDTLFDLPLTRTMLDEMVVHTRTAPIVTLVNTHANGDHCYGNELVGQAEIVASVATAHEMSEVPPAMLAALNAAPARWATCSGRSSVPSSSTASRSPRRRAPSSGGWISRSVVAMSS
ncbi:MAG: MBL fold metallo-hydrolase [Ilumatobacteraceae bacterium]